MHLVKVKGILSAKNGMNLYRGCTHGCIYCDSRSDCYQINHDFEDVEVKENAIELLEQAFISKRNKCMIGTGAMTDPYCQPEKTLTMTRKALQLIDRYGFGVAIQTKSADVLRDIDLLESINRKSKAVVEMTLTTADEELCRKIEPGVSTTRDRIEVLNIMRNEGIPTVVWLSPILPYINDTAENINAILDACIEAKVKGIICFGMGLTLREGNREYFYEKLDESFPGLKEKYQKEFGYSYMINSPRNYELMNIFNRRCDEAGIMRDVNQIFDYMMKFEDKLSGRQLSLF